MIFRRACGKTVCRQKAIIRLRKHHTFIKNIEELLARAKVYLPDNIPEPMDAEDMETLRAAFRYNKTADCGFLFINNHQRKRKMTEKQITPEKPLQFTVTDVEGTQRQISFDRIHVRTDAILVLPYNLPVVIRGEELRLRKPTLLIWDALAEFIISIRMRSRRIFISSGVMAKILRKR